MQCRYLFACKAVLFLCRLRPNRIAKIIFHLICNCSLVWFSEIKHYIFKGVQLKKHLLIILKHVYVIQNYIFQLLLG